MTAVYAVLVDLRPSFEERRETYNMWRVELHGECIFLIKKLIEINNRNTIIFHFLADMIIVKAKKLKSS